MFVKEELNKLKLESDPDFTIKKDVITINRVSRDKGVVFTEKKGIVTLGDYKLVGDDEKYLKFLDGKVFIYFKRNGTTPDTQVGVFDNFDMVAIGFKDIEDPHVVAKRIAEQAQIDSAQLAVDAEEVTMEAMPSAQTKEESQAEKRAEIKAAKIAADNPLTVVN